MTTACKAGCVDRTVASVSPRKNVSSIAASHVIVRRPRIGLLRKKGQKSDRLTHTYAYGCAHQCYAISPAIPAVSQGITRENEIDELSFPFVPSDLWRMPHARKHGNRVGGSLILASGCWVPDAMTDSLANLEFFMNSAPSRVIVTKALFVKRTPLTQSIPIKKFLLVCHKFKRECRTKLATTCVNRKARCDSFFFVFDKTDCSEGMWSDIL